MERMVGTVSRGVRAPIIREGDDIVQIVVDSVLAAAQSEGFSLRDRDVVAVTEAVVARAQGNYATVDQIASDIHEKFGEDTVGVLFPILSRNRFAICLKGIAMGCRKMVLMLSYPSDEVGNHLISEDDLDLSGVNPWSDVLDEQKYRELLDAYHARCAELAKLFAGQAVELLTGIAAAGDFAPAHEAMLAAIEEQKSAAKAEVEALPKRQQKKRREELAAKTAELEAAATEVGEAVWLVEKFGEGEYADVPGLCKVASKKDIQGDQPADKSSWSLTPGAYVGVPPVEDDGVDFHERMGEIQTELTRLQAESNDLMATINRNFRELGL